MSYYIDTHAHIYLEEFDADRNDVFSRAVEGSVKKILMPNIDHSSIDRMLEVELKSNGLCLSMMGLHPCSVNKDFEKELYRVEEWISKRKFIAIGETGTDLYWDKTYWEQQVDAFKIQLRWAKQYKVPIVIHSRDSLDQTIDLVEQLKDDNLNGVFHCFTGSELQAKRVADLGFYMGIGGVVTFKNGGLDKVLPLIDMDRIVLETDSPYLAPVPHRGKRNEPAYIPAIANKVAEIKQVSLEEVERVTTQNAIKLFQLNEYQTN
ncbi:MAG: TatD family hydrolase [Cyclobacteriaceae bacterium]|nr:TatD family hydrolase [Cyclobacteriaceae bacterium]